MNKINKVTEIGKWILGIVLIFLGIILMLFSLVGLIILFSSEISEDSIGFVVFLVLLAAVLATLSISIGARMFKHTKRALKEEKELKKHEMVLIAELEEEKRREQILQAKQRVYELNIQMKRMKEEEKEHQREVESLKEEEQIHREELRKIAIQRLQEKIDRWDNDIIQRRETEADNLRKVEKCIEEIDGMEGHNFEYFCAELLRKNAFENVSVTRGSGDQGVDILAEKDGIRYAIQCKNYASKLGNTPIQEVNTGKTFYNCHVGVVMTNSLFTPKAIELAEATKVILWDRKVMQQFLKQY